MIGEIKTFVFGSCRPHCLSTVAGQARLAPSRFMRNGLGMHYKYSVFPFSRSREEISYAISYKSVKR